MRQEKHYYYNTNYFLAHKSFAQEGISILRLFTKSHSIVNLFKLNQLYFFNIISKYFPSR